MIGAGMKTSRFPRIVAIAVLGASIALCAASAAENRNPCKPERWAEEIAAIEKKDTSMPPPKGGVLFLGSSSIRNWKVEKWFPDLPVANRGFGGSQICDSTHYADRLATIHQPRLVVFYAGDNDIAADKSPEQVRDDFRDFVEKVRKPQPKLPIVFISIKPSIARWHLRDKIRQANELIEADAGEDGNISYVDVWPAMLDEKGEPRKDIFLEDGLHMNDKGYDLWAEELRPLLKKD
jgi:lysophospholipase L1-like esterase